MQQQNVKNQPTSSQRKKPAGKGASRVVLCLVTLAALAVLGFSLWQLFGIRARYEESDAVYDEILSHMGQEAVPLPARPDGPAKAETSDTSGNGFDTVETQSASETEGDAETEGYERPYTLTVPDFDYLRGVNSDVIGWIQIPGTRIDYPIVQGSDNEYYLEHVFSGEVNNAGAIFMDAGVTDGFDDRNPIIHGHNLKSGAMFSRLNRYSRVSFWNANRYIYITTPDGLYIYEVFSAYETTTDTDIYYFGFSANDEFQEYIDRVYSYSVHDAGLEVTSEDHIITLSTCANDTSRRFVVHAKRVQ